MISVKQDFPNQISLAEENWISIANGAAAFGGKFKDKALQLETKLTKEKDFLFGLTDYKELTNVVRFKNSKDPNFGFIVNGCKS